MSEINFPDDWVACSISDVAQVNPKKLDAEPDTISGFVPMALAPVSFSDSLRYEEKHWKEISKSYTNFQNGDVIFAKVTPCFENGKASIVDGLPNGIGAGSSEFYVLRPHTPYVLPKILFALIKTQKFANDGAANMTGAVGLRRVPRAFVESFDAPMIPIAEQKVIAEKLDNLLAQVEATKARLESTLETLKQFRQSVLAAAVSGKLTEDWRQNISEYPDLHEAISELEKKTLDNAPTKAQRTKLEKVYAGKEKPVSLDFEMPEKWLECNLAKLCEPFSYGSSSKSQASGDVPVLRMGNLQNGKLDWSDLVYTSNEEEINKYELQTNDVLFNRTNSPELVGKTAIFKGERKAIYAGYLIRARCLSLLSPDYLNIVLNSPYGKDYCSSVKSDGVSQSNINAQKLGAFVIPLPSIQEQAKVVNSVERLFAGADVTEQQVNQALERVNNLTQSILAKAFRGELTEQWRKENPELISGDNSAEALLKKIKAERAAAKPKRKARTTSA
ncbi:restriction endonuclease subunit S [Vibrio alginolyticus]|uniref:restriction endonuclease subunit S n=1 Tax=Vibrio alginolyticus TaxID=663 RepID=UPI0021601AA8|nr:restriction endonuclease subunit S [Vibrio alginolyticus]MCS0164800.1 restriction endonuclease subunit S [Vibrio alginolyticus]MCS0209252.1 restriction endonuclease subunit S [Vibrio alginolyticus]